MTETLDYIDCQGFAGGMTLGVTQAGLRLVGKREDVGGFGLANCEANRHLLGDAWRGEASAPHLWTALSMPVVVGNPPCSGFSVMTDKRARGVDAKINACMWNFARYAARCQPVIAAFESVRSAFSLGRPLMQALRAELESLTDRQYTLYHVMHNAIDLGAVSQRPRYFWVASSVPFGVEWESHPRWSYWDAIADLEHLPVKMELQPYVSEPTSWSRQSLSPNGLVDGHQTARKNPHQERLAELFKFADQEEIGGWREGETMPKLLQRMYETTGEVPPLFQPGLQHMIDRDWVMGFVNPMRFKRELPCRVIDGASLDRAVHPTQSRTITHREAARVMGFPDDWLIAPIQSPPTVLMQTWGKGITVHCGRWLGRWIKNSINGQPGSDRGILIGDREYFMKQGGAGAIRSVQQMTTAPNRGDTIMPRRKPAPANPIEETTNVTDNVEAAATAAPETTDQTAPQANASAAAASTETTDATGRGRPRPQHTIERDRKVLAFLDEQGGNWQVKDIAEKLGGEFQPNVVKACLDRLSWGDGNQKDPRNPLVIKVSRSTWRSASVPAPVEPEQAAAPEPQATETTEAAAAQAPEGEPEVTATTAQWS